MNLSDVKDLPAFSKEAVSIKKGVYRHYKGGLYLVLAIGRHTETLEEYVLYRAIDGQKEHWVRPVSLFVAHVVHQGKTVPRFSYQAANE